MPASDETWRCFVAVPIPEDLRVGPGPGGGGLAWRCPASAGPALDRTRRLARDPRLPRPGERRAGSAAVRGLVGAAVRPFQPFTVPTGGLGAFPRAGAAMTAWYGVGDPDGDARRAGGGRGRGGSACGRHDALSPASDPGTEPRTTGRAARPVAGHDGPSRSAFCRSRKRSCTAAISAAGRPGTKSSPAPRWAAQNRVVPETASRPPRAPVIAVIGDADPRGPEAHRILEHAEEVGQLLARAGATVVTGGLGGVMRSASRGAASEGGLTIGILPGADAAEANEFVQLAIPTGLGVVRNLVVVTVGRCRGRDRRSVRDAVRDRPGPAHGPRGGGPGFVAGRGGPAGERAPPASRA